MNVPTDEEVLRVVEHGWAINTEYGERLVKSGLLRAKERAVEYELTALGRRRLLDHKMENDPPSRNFTLGQLIYALENRSADDMRNDATIRFDFNGMIPTNVFNSYRGCYEDLAIRPEVQAYGHPRPTVLAFLAALKKQIGNVECGYKGGEYTSNEQTKLWVADSNGECTSTGIVGLVDEGWNVVLRTEYIR